MSPRTGLQGERAMLQYIINLGQRSRNEPIVVAASRAVGQHMGGGGR